MIITVAILSFSAGLAVAWAAASYRIRQIRRDDLSFRTAPVIEDPIVVAARHVGA